MKAFAKGPSITVQKRAAMTRIKSVSARTPGAIRLESGVPDFPTPEHIVEAGCKAAQEGYTKYTGPRGYLSLRELIVGKLERVNHFQATPENITVTAGAANAIMAALIALVESGDEVLIPDPAWTWAEQIRCIPGAALKTYPLDAENDFLPDISGLEKVVTERTKVLIMNTPSNPLGSVFPREVVRDMVEFAQRHDLYIISDEPYEELVFEGEHVSPVVFDSKRVVGCYTFSKTYAMTGWRLGYAVASTELSKAITVIVRSMVSGATSVSQKAGEAALSGPQDCVKMMRDSYRERRDAALDILKAHGVPVYKPQGAFYLWFDISQSGMGSTDFALALLKEKEVAVRPGDICSEYPSNYIRISLATEKGALMEGMERICSFLAQ